MSAESGPQRPDLLIAPNWLPKPQDVHKRAENEASDLAGPLNRRRTWTACYDDSLAERTLAGPCAECSPERRYLATKLYSYSFSAPPVFPSSYLLELQPKTGMALHSGDLEDATGLRLVISFRNIRHVARRRSSTEPTRLWRKTQMTSHRCLPPALSTLSSSIYGCLFGELASAIEQERARGKRTICMACSLGRSA